MASGCCTFETEKVLYLLGTLEAAASLSEVCAGYCCHVDTLVTLCADDLKVRGAPCDWRSFCAEQGVSAVVYSYQDLTVTCSQNTDLFVQQANLATKLWETLRQSSIAHHVRCVATGRLTNSDRSRIIGDLF